MFRGIHKVNYKRARRANPPKKVRRLPPGTWLPISVAAYVLHCTNQTVHLLRLTKQMASIRFPKGPILVNVADMRRKESGKWVIGS